MSPPQTKTNPAAPCAATPACLQDPNRRNAEGSTPLHWACLNGRSEVVRLLMDRGASATVLNR